MLKTTVKAGAVTHLTDARYFAAWEVAYLGFDLSNEGISALELNALREWITGPQLIGEVGLLMDGQLPPAIHELRLDGIQFNELVAAEDIAALVTNFASTDRPEPGDKQPETQALFFQEYVVQGYNSIDDLEDFLAERKSSINHFVLNFSKGGITWQDLVEGNPFELSALKRICSTYPILLEIEGQLPTHIMNELPALGGFSLRGGEEEKVGYKDFDGMGDFFEDLEVE